MPRRVVQHADIRNNSSTTGARIGEYGMGTVNGVSSARYASSYDGRLTLRLMGTRRALKGARCESGHGQAYNHGGAELGVNFTHVPLRRA